MTTNTSTMLVLIVGIKTTGPRSSGGEIIEIGAALYSVQFRCIVREISTLLPPSRPSSSRVRINQIPVGAAMEATLHSAQSVCSVIVSWAHEAKYCVADNAEVTKKWIENHYFLAGLAQHSWLCTRYDFVWPRQQRAGKNLVHIALEHSIEVKDTHRALSECQAIAFLLTFVDESLVQILNKAARPKCKVFAKVHFSDREALHNAGFNWDGTTRVFSRWVAIEDLPSLPVQCAVIEVDHRGNDAVAWARLWQMYISHKVQDNTQGKCLEAFEDLGRILWNYIRNVPAMLTACRKLWAESERGGIEPSGLFDVLQAMELWYHTSSCGLLQTTETKNSVHTPQQLIYNLPDVLGIENEETNNPFDECSNSFSLSVENVIENVAQSCLEPEDRVQAGNFPQQESSSVVLSDTNQDGSESISSPKTITTSTCSYT